MNKQYQLRLHSAASVLLLLALFVLCAWLSTRYNFTADVTRSGRHSLSPASVQILAKADKPLKIKAYAREDSELRSLIRKFIARFRRVKPDISEVVFINPDAAPDEVRDLGINVNGELVLHYDGREEHVKTNSEQEFVNALQRLLRGSERWLAFLEGHGERHPGGKANHDLGEWVAQLAYRGYKYQSINLVETRVIPDNTAVLIIASPMVTLLKSEVTIIEGYLDKGGNLLWLTDPGDQPGLDAIAEKLGVSVAAGVVIDNAGQLLGINDPTMVLTTARLYPQHPITAGFDLTVFFPKAAAITAQARQGWLSQAVLNSGNHTWLELGELADEVSFNPELERQDSLTLGLSFERQAGPTEGHDAKPRQQRVLVIGDGDFLSNTYVGNSGNMELGMRMINWLSSDDDLVSIPPGTVEDAQLNMSQLALGALGLGFLLVLPLAFLATGFYRWWQRKKL